MLSTWFIQPTDHNDHNLTWGGMRLREQDLAAGLELLPEGFEAPQHGLNAGLHGALHLARGKLLDAADQPALAATAYQRALLQVWSPSHISRGTLGTCTTSWGCPLPD